MPPEKLVIFNGKKTSIQNAPNRPNKKPKITLANTSQNKPAKMPVIN